MSCVLYFALQIQLGIDHCNETFLYFNSFVMSCVLLQRMSVIGVFLILIYSLYKKTIVELLLAI
jgi:hypothetical protein